MTGFWKTWMIVWCWMVFGFGVVLALAAFPGPDIAAALFYDLVEWPLDGAVTFEPRARFTVAILGAVTIGWALTIFGMIKAAETVGPPVWRALTTALVVWYVIDSALSILTGVPVNAVSNTVLLVTYLVPVLASGVLQK
jgi:hypothetical protein